MAIALKQLAQTQLTTTAATSIFQVTAGQEAVIKAVRVCNTSAGNVTIVLYHDNDGTTYDNTTTVLPQTTVAANKIVTDGGEMTYMMNNTAGNFAAKAGTANALTITLYGFIRT
jgi:hypothetical protein